MGRWIARIAILAYAGLVVIVLSGVGALGSLGLPMVQATSPSPSRSASPSGSASGSPSSTPCRVPLPPLCPSPSASGSPSRSPSGSPTGSPGPTPPPGDEPVRHESKITISYSHEFFTFSGEVRSATRCERSRDVVLKRVREGRDPIVGRDVTNRRGRWSVRVPGADGRFYAKVLKRTFVDNETRVICQADRSRTVRA